MLVTIYSLYVDLRSTHWLKLCPEYERCLRTCLIAAEEIVSLCSFFLNVSGDLRRQWDKSVLMARSISPAKADKLLLFC